MFLWVGCKLPENFEKTLRAHCLALNEKIGLGTAPFSLPQHISLKISFDAGEQCRRITQWLETELKTESRFYVNLLPPEQMASILWLPVADNPRLTALHEKLDRELEHRFGIPQHPFDREFRFHSTLFMDEDTEKLSQMAALLSPLTFPDPLPIDTFLIGLSADGKTDFQILREVNIS